MRLLTIESCDADAQWLAKQLEAAAEVGLSVERAPAYAPGLRRLLCNAHDACVLASRLGADSGAELLRTATLLGSRVPVVILATHPGPDTEQEALAAGAADCLPKGLIEAEALCRNIRYAIDRKRQIHRQAQLINHYCEETHSAPRLRLDALDLSAELTELGAALTGAFTRCGLLLVLQIDDGVVAWADAEKLRSALRALLGNALKFTPSGGRVVVRCRTTADGPTVEIEDNGLGVPEALQARVFERYFTVSGPQRAPLSGPGLGLWQARHLVEDLHDGQIEVRSAPGRGSLFSLTLAPPPVAEPAGRNTPAPARSRY